MANQLRNRANNKQARAKVAPQATFQSPSKSTAHEPIYYPIGKAFMLSIPFPFLICAFSWFLVSADAFPLPRIPFLLFTHFVLIFCNAPIAKTRSIHAFSKTLLACTFILSAIHNIAISHTIHSLTPTALTSTYAHITPETVALPSFYILLNRDNIVSHPAACILASDGVPCAAKPLFSISSWTLATTDSFTPTTSTDVSTDSLTTTPSASPETLAQLASLSSLLAHASYSIPRPSQALVQLLSNTDTFQRAVLVGLVMSWLGDVFLLAGQRDSFFLAGLGAFLLGHVGYVVANVSRIEALLLSDLFSTRAFVGFACILAFAAVCLRWLFGSGNIRGTIMKVAVPAYIVVITCMLLSAYTASVVAPLPAGALHTDVTMHYSPYIRDLHISSGAATHTQPLPACGPNAQPGTYDYSYRAATLTDAEGNTITSSASSTLSSSSLSTSLPTPTPKLLPALAHTVAAVKDAYQRTLLPLLEPYFGPWVALGGTAGAEDKAYTRAVSTQEAHKQAEETTASEAVPSQHAHAANTDKSSAHDAPSSGSVTCLFDHALLPGPSWQALLLFFGGALFAISDVFVANEKFIRHTHLNRTVGLAVYFYAQILISSALRY